MALIILATIITETPYRPRTNLLEYVMITKLTVTAPPGALGVYVDDDKTDHNFHTIVTKVSGYSNMSAQLEGSNYRKFSFVMCRSAKTVQWPKRYFLGIEWWH